MHAAYTLQGQGSDLAIAVRGPDAVACIAAAVEGLAASVGRVAADADRRRARVELRADDPAVLLIDVLDDAIARLDADGELAAALTGATLSDGTLRGWLELVPLEHVEVHGDPPKAATWHDLQLRDTGGQWQGRVVLDL